MRKVSEPSIDHRTKYPDDKLIRRFPVCMLKLLRIPTIWAKIIEFYDG